MEVLINFLLYVNNNLNCHKKKILTLKENLRVDCEKYKIKV